MFPIAFCAHCHVKRFYRRSTLRCVTCRRFVWEVCAKYPGKFNEVLKPRRSKT